MRLLIKKITILVTIIKFIGLLNMNTYFCFLSFFLSFFLYMFR